MTPAPLREQGLCGSQGLTRVSEYPLRRIISLPAGSRSSLEKAAALENYGEAERKPEEMTLVPYFLWNNRGEGEMTVWMQAR